MRCGSCFLSPIAGIALHFDLLVWYCNSTIQRISVLKNIRLQLWQCTAVLAHLCHLIDGCSYIVWGRVSRISVDEESGCGPVS